MKKTVVSLFLLLFCQVVISQNLQWVKNMEGLRNCEGNSIALDAIGNVYTTGYFDSIMDFDPGPGTYTLASQGRRDVFISKLDGSGHFIWAKTMGSLGDEVGNAVKIDGFGNVVVTGSYSGLVDFDPGSGIYTLSSNSLYGETFILKLDNNGNFIWAKSTNTTQYVEAKSLSIDPSGNIVLTGRFMGNADFDPGSNVYTVAYNNSNGHPNLFIAKLDAFGNFMWAQGYGIYGWHESMFITNDASGNVYMTGSYAGSVDFDAGIGSQIHTSPSHNNTYFLKLDAGGNFIWVKEFGDSTNHSYGYSMTLDNLGSIYATGSFSGTKDFDPGVGTFTMTAPFSEDSYLMKLDTSGNFIWARQMSGGMSKGFGISLDNFGNIITTGIYDGFSDIDSGPGVYNLNITIGAPEMYFMKTHPITGGVLSAKIFGAGSWCHGTSIASDSQNNIYATGFFEGTGLMIDFDPGPATFTLNTTDRNTNFILKLNDNTTTGLDESNDKSKIIAVYPNPNNGIFTITAKEHMKLNLYDNLGQVIQTIELNAGNKFQYNINVLGSGIYFISGQSDKQTFTQKIIVTQ